MTASVLNDLKCLTISCKEPRSLAEIIEKNFDWKIYKHGSIDPELETLWGIKENSAGTDFYIFQSENMNRGMIRIVSGNDRIRSKNRSRRWGGFEIVIMENIDELYDNLNQNINFLTFGKPDNYDFTSVQSNIHRAFSGTIPGGTHFTATMKITEPSNRIFPKSKTQVGHIFEVPLNTSNYLETKNFYKDILGMEKVLELITEDGPMHKTWNIPKGHEYSLGIFKGSGEGSGLGAVEIHGCSSDFIDPEFFNTSIFDGGACLVTYGTHNIDKVYNKVLNCSAASIIKEPKEILSSPYSGSKAFSFFGPNKERIEIIESWK